MNGVILTGTIKPSQPSKNYKFVWAQSPIAQWKFRGGFSHTKGDNVKYARLVIISGGQTGADRAGLDVARLMGISTGGWAARDFMTSEGPDPSLEELGLRPIAVGPGMNEYAERTRKNIELADVTLVFAFNRASPGTRLTINHCVNKNHLYYVVDLGKDDLASKPQEVVAWLKSYATVISKQKPDEAPFILNIAGNREVPGTTKVYDATAAFVAAILRYWSTWEES